MLVLSLYWQIGEGFSPIRAALSLAPLSLGMVVGMGASFALVGGSDAGSCTEASRSRRSACSDRGDGPLGRAPVGLVDGPGVFVTGLGMGAVFGQLFDVTLTSVADSEVGSASGLLNALQQLSSRWASRSSRRSSRRDGRAAPAVHRAGGHGAAVGRSARFELALAFRLPERARAEAH